MRDEEQRLDRCLPIDISELDFLWTLRDARRIGGWQCLPICQRCVWVIDIAVNGSAAVGV